MTISTIRSVKRGQIKLLDGAQDRPHNVILGHPVQQRRRQQQRLTTITTNEFLGHTGIVLRPPDRPVYPTATREAAASLARSLTTAGRPMRSSAAPPSLLPLLGQARVVRWLSVSPQWRVSGSPVGRSVGISARRGFDSARRLQTSFVEFVALFSSRQDTSSMIALWCVTDFRLLCFRSCSPLR